jgi:hypothetical protein
MQYRIHPLYKNLLILAIVLGPIVWLVLTEDGQRRTDLVLLALLGKPEIKLAVEHLTADVTEADLRRLYPDLPLSCSEGPNPYGDRLCGAKLGAFNQIPSHDVAFYLAGQRLRALKVNYRPHYHDSLKAQLAERLAKEGILAEVRGGALAWQVDGGVLLMPVEAPQDDREAALMWLSTEVLAGASVSGG